MIQLVWSTVLALHAVGAAVFWWTAPGGFPTSSSEHWVNAVAPVVPIVLVGAALFTRGRLAAAVLPVVLAAIPLFWMTFAISLRLTFPADTGGIWYLPFFGGFALLVIWVRQYGFRVPRPLLLVLVAALALIAGWAAPSTMRADEPMTRPAETTLAEPAAGASTTPKLIKLGKEAQVHPGEGRIVMKRDQVLLTVQPLLTFADRSPDRFFTSSAAPEDNTPTRRRFASMRRDGARWALAYGDEDRSQIDVELREGTLEIDARSRLARAVFAHLDSFLDLTIRGHRKLSVAFSPMPGRRVEVPAPGAPARFAYVDAGGTLHVVDAAQARHGPFTELASGPLVRDRPLSLTLYDGDRAVFRVTVPDFAPQASTRLSPAAGWGVPENMIELVRGGEAENAPALVSFSLATTSIGRGTRSVGHAPGVYRDRVTVEQP